MFGLPPETPRGAAIGYTIMIFIIISLVITPYYSTSVWPHTIPSWSLPGSGSHNETRTSKPPPAVSQPSEPQPSGPQPKLTTVSMLWGNIPHGYQVAMEKHKEYAELHNYRFEVLDKQISTGYWSKCFYLLTLVSNELMKDPENRLEWVMWFDADTVIWNHNVPIYNLMPKKDDPLYDDVHFVVARDGYGINTGILFVRVIPQTIEVLARSYGYYAYHPDYFFGGAYDQVSMNQVIEEPEYKAGGHILYQPKHWFNPTAWDQKDGGWLVHYWIPLDHDQRGHLMEDLVKDMPDHPENWPPYEQTFYPAEIEAYYAFDRTVRTNLKDVRARMSANENDAALNATLATADEGLVNLLFHADLYVDLADNLTTVLNSIPAKEGNQPALLPRVAEPEVQGSSLDQCLGWHPGDAEPKEEL